jgi:hypothetical protein
MFCSLVDVDGRPYPSASTKPVRLLLKIFIHSFTLHCGKQFCPYLANNCRWISATFIPSDTKSAQLHVACPWCKTVVEVMFTLRSLGTNGLHLYHTRSMSPSDLELQYDQASAVLPIIQRKYSNVALTFRISFLVFQVDFSNRSLHQYSVRVFV